MLSIEISKPGRMTILGKGLLRTLQNEFMPNLDLLVRESIQNSLDASLEKSRSVHVDFTVSQFKSEDLAFELEEIGPKLVKRYPKNQTFLAISDKGTEGLTGPLSHDHVVGQSYGNLVKLVYDIAKPQEQQGAGGSWGYGKTIFYRVGIGLVFFYTRIETSPGEYEERLVASMVENEDDPNALLPPAQGTTTKSGVAWWGEKIGDNKTQPVTDPLYIHSILKIFGLDPYRGSETGTSIIIPYINEKELMDHNAIEAKNGKKASDIFDGSLKDYLPLVIQRWYAPRLNNKFYSLGNKTYLRASINEQIIEEEDEHPYFRLLKDMYNYALSGKKSSLKFFQEEDLTRDPIRLRNREGIEMEKSLAGHLVYGSFDYKELGLMREHEPMDPHYLSNIARKSISEENNTAIITFCRQPGMLVNYEDDGKWANNIDVSPLDTYNISLFVLNSNNKVKAEGKEEISLEEYIRQGEESDHTTWEDHAKLGKNPNIVDRIRQNVNNRLKDAYEESGPELRTDNDGRLSIKAGELILPPVGFGTRARKKRKKNPSKSIVRETAGGKTKIDLDNMEFSQDGIKVPIKYQILTPSVTHILVDLEIKNDNNSLSLSRYEQEVFNKSPIFIRDCYLENQDGELFSYTSHDKDVSFLNKKTKLGTVYQLILKKDFFVGEIIKGSVFIQGLTKEFVPVLRLKVEKGDIK